MTGLLVLAFGAGLLAPVNPCGFGLLPAMLTATLGHPADTRQRGVAARLAGGLRAGLALTVGFTTTFVVIGLGLTAGIRSLITVVPWIAAGIGAVLVLVGLALLAGWHLPVTLPGRQPHTTVGGGVGRIVVFGAGYAIASASCTLAVLLAVVTQAAATTLIGAVAVFAAYAAGSALLLITLALLASFAGHALAAVMQRVARYAGRIAGALLAVSGAYLLLYWLPQLLGTTRLGDAGLAGLAGRVATAITEHQPAVALTAAVLVAIATAAVIRTRHTPTDTPQTTEDCCPAQDPTATTPASPEHTSR